MMSITLSDLLSEIATKLRCVEKRFKIHAWSCRCLSTRIGICQRLSHCLSARTTLCPKLSNRGPDRLVAEENLH